MRRRGFLDFLVRLMVSVWACAIAHAISAAADASLGQGLEWETVAVEAADNRVSALALDASGRLAVGDARGVHMGAVGGPMRRVSLRGAVQDLAFFEAGQTSAPLLLAATSLGFYRIETDGQMQSISPGTGAEARLVTRIAVAPGWVAVATGAGAFLSTDAEHWLRLFEELPSGPASAVALREWRGGVECWVAAGGELWRGEIRLDGAAIDVSPPTRVAIPYASSSRVPIDLAHDIGGVDIVVVFESALVVRGENDETWELLRPTLPPGAVMRRIVSGLNRAWLATDRGLLVAQSLRGPWQRVFGVAGSSAVEDMVVEQGALFVATHDGLLLAHSSSRGSGAKNVAVPSIDPAEPEIFRVHQEALRYLKLQPARIAALHRGLARRGWLPIVSFRATHDRDRRRGSDYDEAYLSGDYRDLHDWDDDRYRGLELQFIVSWNLGDLAYHPESIDVSREAREVIELRDDVLDEISQLYFERRRVLAAAASQISSVEAGALVLRAAQLAAGIDAWTGGWFGRQLTPQN
jgi:hypothetical protein